MANTYENGKRDSILFSIHSGKKTSQLYIASNLFQIVFTVESRQLSVGSNVGVEFNVLDTWSTNTSQIFTQQSSIHFIERLNRRHLKIVNKIVEKKRLVIKRVKQRSEQAYAREHKIQTKVCDALKNDHERERDRMWTEMIQRQWIKYILFNKIHVNMVLFGAIYDDRKTLIDSHVSRLSIAASSSLYLSSMQNWNKAAFSK